MTHGSDSHMEFLRAPKCTPYYLAPVTRMTHFRERALVNLRALRKLSSMAPREWGQCVEWVRWGAEVGREVKGDATVHFSVFFLSLSGGRRRRRRIELSPLRSLAISWADEVRSIWLWMMLDGQSSFVVRERACTVGHF